MQTVEEIENHFANSTKPLTADFHTRSKRNPDRIEVARVMVLGIENHSITVALRSALNYEDLFKASLKSDDGEPYFITEDFSKLPLASVRDDATEQEVWSCGRIKEPRGDKSVARLNFERGRDIKTLATYVTNIREAGDVDRVIDGLNDFKVKYFGEGAEDGPDLSYLIQRPSDFIAPPAVTFNLAQLDEPGILPALRVDAEPEAAVPAPQEPEVEEGPKQRVTNLGVSYRDSTAEIEALPVPSYTGKPQTPQEYVQLSEGSVGETSYHEGTPEGAVVIDNVGSLFDEPKAEEPEPEQEAFIPEPEKQDDPHQKLVDEGETQEDREPEPESSSFVEPLSAAPEQDESRKLVDEGEIKEVEAVNPLDLFETDEEAPKQEEQPVHPGPVSYADEAKFFDDLLEAPKQEEEQPKVQVESDREDAGDLGGFFDDLPEPADDHEPVKPEGAKPAISFLDVFKESMKEEPINQAERRAEQEVYHDGNPLPGYPHEEERKPWVPPAERDQPKAEVPEPVKQEEPETPKPVVDPNKNRSFLDFLDRNDPDEDEKEDEDEDDLGPIKPVAQSKPVVAPDIMSFLND